MVFVVPAHVPERYTRYATAPVDADQEREIDVCVVPATERDVGAGGPEALSLASAPAAPRRRLERMTTVQARASEKRFVLCEACAVATSVACVGAAPSMAPV